MLKRTRSKRRKEVTRPLLFSNPFYSTGYRKTPKVFISNLPTGVFSIEQRDRFQDARRDRERTRTGALSTKQLVMKVMRQAKAKEKFLNQIKKIAEAQGESDELAQRINAVREVDTQWRKNAPQYSAIRKMIDDDINKVMPNATKKAKDNASLLYESVIGQTGGTPTLEGTGLRPKDVIVPRIFQITRPESRRETRPIDMMVKENEANEAFRHAHQDAYRKYLKFIHGTEPPSDMVKEAFPTTAEPLVAVSTPKPNPTVAIHQLHTRTPFSVAKW